MLVFIFGLEIFNEFYESWILLLTRFLQCESIGAHILRLNKKTCALLKAYKWMDSDHKFTYFHHSKEEETIILRSISSRNCTCWMRNMCPPLSFFETLVPFNVFSSNIIPRLGNSLYNPTPFPYLVCACSFAQ